MKKISVTGPECSGKSWLSARLAAHFGTVWVPEYARDYLPRLSGPYSADDVSRIAEGQAHAEAECAARASEWLFCDTDMLVCKIWAEIKFGFCPPEIQKLYEETPYDLYLLCRPDLPWAPDPLREAPDENQRKAIFAAYERQLRASGRPYRIVEGQGEARLSCALAHLGAWPT